MALKPAICTQCGGQIQVDDSKEAGVCPNCGTAFITEKVIQNITNVTQNNFAGATINMKTGPSYENALKLARKARELGDTEKAIKYYEQVREETPEIWDAEFYYPYYRTMDAGIAQIARMTTLMTKAMGASFELLRKSDEQLKKEYFIKMANDVVELIEDLATSQIRKMNGVRDVITSVTDNTGRLEKFAILLNVLFQELLKNGEEYYEDAVNIYIHGIDVVMSKHGVAPTKIVELIMPKRGIGGDFINSICEELDSLKKDGCYKKEIFLICKHILNLYNNTLPKNTRKSLIKLCKNYDSSFRAKLTRKTKFILLIIIIIMPFILYFLVSLIVLINFLCS